MSEYRLPYKIADYVYIEKYGDKVVYFNLKNGNYIKIPLFVHEWIKSECKTDVVEKRALDYLYILLEKLIDKEYITLDLEKIKLFENFIFIPNNQPIRITEKTDFINIYIDNINIISDLIKLGYIKNKTTINFICLDTNLLLPHSNLYYDKLNLIIKNFSLLSNLNNYKFKNINIEVDRIPTENEIDLLVRICSNSKLKIIMNYVLENNIVLSVVEKTKNINNIEISYDICLMHIDNSKTERTCDFVNNTRITHYLLNSLKLSCGAGKNKFFINKEGFIFPCYLLKGKVLGNIYEDNPNDLIEQQKHYENISARECTKCSVKLFCGGGCKANYINNQYANCSLVKDILEKQLKL